MTTNKPKRVYLLDGTALIYRSYYAFINNPLRNSQGHNTSAIFGVANTFLKLLDQHSPQKVIVSFDLKKPTFRHEMTDTYKANRPPAPDELIEQVQSVKEFFNRLSIPDISIEGYEADDVIATLAKTFQDDYEVMIVTGDKDFCQIVNQRITLYDPFTDKYLRPDTIEKKYGIQPEQFRDYLAIIGDNADNIPGIKGIGPKGARTLLNQYETLDEIYENIDEIQSKSLKNKLQEGAEEVKISRKLVTLVEDVPLTKHYNISDILTYKTIETADLKKLIPFIKEHELNSLYKKIDAMVKKYMQGEDPPDQHHSQEAEYDESNEQQSFFDQSPVDRKPNENSTQAALGFYTEHFEYQNKVIDSSDSAHQLLEKLKEKELIAIEVMNSPKEEHGNLMVAVATDEEKVFFIDLRPSVCKLLKEIKLTNQPLSSLKIVAGHNLKNCCHKVGNYCTEDDGIEGTAFELIHALLSFLSFTETNTTKRMIPDDTGLFDCMVASYLTDANNPQHNLAAIVNREFGYDLMTKKKYQKSLNNKGLINEELISFSSGYLTKQAFFIYRLYHQLRRKVEPYSSLYYDIEMPLTMTLAKMEQAGVYVDTDKLKEINSFISSGIEELTETIQSMAGKEFNINSPQQLSKVLFSEMKLPVIKKTSTGYSTDSSVLEKLSEKHEIAKHLIEYRQLTKLKSTYIESLPTLIENNTGRIHSTFNQTVTTTGRLSSSNPNLQNIPIRSEAGKHIRKAFMPEPDKNDELTNKYGKVLILSADYSQIELRLLGSMSKDRNLVSAFNNRQDIHSQTAGLILGKPITQVTQDERRMAKTINFGLIYGMGPVKLSKEINVSREEAKRFIEEYFKKFPKIKDFINSTVVRAKRKGYAETIMGRRLYLPNIMSSSQRYASEAERVAFNMPIQGSAADVIKLAMIRIDKKIDLLHSRYDDFSAGKSYAMRMIIQVHDELVFEVRESFISQAKEIIVNEMKKALPEKYRIIVPLAVDVGWGSNWYESHG